jgi:4-hydroxybenzoate polyprenyltransferase
MRRSESTPDPETRPLARARAFVSTIAPYARLMRLHRPVGWLLCLWPTLWAVWIAAAGRPAATMVVVFTIGVIVMRSAGCIVNDLADRRYDGSVERTRDRPLVTGAVTPRAARLLALALLAIAALLLVFLNALAVTLSFAGVALAIVYPFMKRYTYLPQVFLGFAFGWGIPMAFAAITGTVPPLAWLVFATNVVWVLVYDTLYAMIDRDDDLRIGVKSTAILFEDNDRIIVGVLQAVLVLGFLLVGQQAGRGMVFTGSVLVAAGLCVYQQVLIFDRSRTGCFAAFNNNNWLGAVIFAGLVLDYGLA